MVHAAPRALPHASQLGALRRRRHVRAEHRGARRRRQAGGVSAVVEFLRDLLRADVSRDVRGADRGDSRTRAGAGVAASRGAVGISDDAAGHRPLDRADRAGREPVRVRGENHNARRRHQCDWRRDLLTIAKAEL